MHSFTQIKHAASEIGAQLVLVHLPPEIEHSLRTRGLIDSDIVLAPELDRALESCENAIIAAHRDKEDEARSLFDWLTAALGSPALAKRMVQLCERHEIAAGETIARQGEGGGLHAFHPRRPRRDRGRDRRWALDAFAQPRTAHHDRGDGPDHAPAAQRHHPGGSRERALFAEHRGL